MVIEVLYGGCNSTWWIRHRLWLLLLSPLVQTLRRTHLTAILLLEVGGCIGASLELFGGESMLSTMWGII